MTYQPVAYEMRIEPIVIFQYATNRSRCIRQGVTNLHRLLKNSILISFGVSATYIALKIHKQLLRTRSQHVGKSYATRTQVIGSVREYGIYEQVVYAGNKEEYVTHKQTFRIAFATRTQYI